MVHGGELASGKGGVRKQLVNVHVYELPGP